MTIKVTIPIISLCSINKASFLIELCDELIISKEVAEEIDRGTEDDPAKIWLQQFGGSYVKEVGPIETVVSLKPFPSKLHSFHPQHPMLFSSFV